MTALNALSRVQVAPQAPVRPIVIPPKFACAKLLPLPSKIAGPIYPTCAQLFCDRQSGCFVTKIITSVFRVFADAIPQESTERLGEPPKNYR
jgi:hypothetical protein